MELYKSDRVISKGILKYSGLQVSTGDIGKIMVVGKDLISVLWDKDKRQLARLTPPNEVLKLSEVPFDEFNKVSFVNLKKLADVKQELEAQLNLIKQAWENPNLDEAKKLELIVGRYNKLYQNRAFSNYKGVWLKFVEGFKNILGVDAVEMIKQKYPALKDILASANSENIKTAKGKPWSRPEKEKLKSKALDKTEGNDIEVNNMRPNESNILDYGKDPLAQDNFTGKSGSKEDSMNSALKKFAYKIADCDLEKMCAYDFKKMSGGKAINVASLICHALTEDNIFSYDEEDAIYTMSLEGTQGKLANRIWLEDKVMSKVAKSKEVKITRGECKHQVEAGSEEAKKAGLNNALPGRIYCSLWKTQVENVIQVNGRCIPTAYLSQGIPEGVTNQWGSENKPEGKPIGNIENSLPN